MHTFAMRNRRRNMTTIQIAVVVALVFFAVISVVVLIVWKRETEMMNQQYTVYRRHAGEHKGRTF